MPHTTKRKKSVSHKDTNDTVCPRSPENSDDHNRSSRTLFRRQSTVEHFSQIDENEDNMSQGKNEQTLNRYLSFAVGGLLGDICLHLLPEIYSAKIDSSTIYDERRQLRLGLSILTGILSFLAIEKLSDITQYSADKGNNNHNISQQEDRAKPVVGYLNLLANGIDNFVHGLAVAASFLTSFKMGILTVIAILVHEIPHEIGDFAILLKNGFSR